MSEVARTLIKDGLLQGDLDCAGYQLLNITLDISNLNIQPLNSNLTAISALTTVAFGRGLLEQANAAAARTYIGTGTSSFNGVYTSLDFTGSSLASLATKNFSALTIDTVIPAAWIGTTGTTVAAGNDSRLTNTRTPSAASTSNAMIASDAAIDWTKISKSGSNITDIATRLFSSLQSIPTTRAGYGITDAVGNTGNESISGVKTLNSPPILGAASASTLGYIDANKNLVSIATATQRGIEKHLWIAKRTDSLPGTGTAEDPLDASTTSKFDTIMNAAVANTTFHFAPNTTFTTKGTIGFHPKSGWKWIATPTTTFKLDVFSAGDVTNLSDSNNRATIFGTAGTVPIGATAFVEDIVIDGGIWDLNMNVQTQELTPSAIALFADGVTVRNAKFINWGSTHGFEEFVVHVYGDGNVQSRVYSRGCLHENLEFTQPADEGEGALPFDGQISLLAPGAGSNPDSQSAISDGWFQGVTVRNCYFHDLEIDEVQCINPNGYISGLECCNNKFCNLNDDNNRIGYYWDTGSGFDISIHDDIFIDCATPIGFINGTGYVRERISIEREHISGSSYVGISLSQGSGGTCSDVTIADNYINIAAADNAVINCHTVSSLRLRNNVIELAPAGAGTRFTSTNCTISEQHNNRSVAGELIANDELASPLGSYSAVRLTTTNRTLTTTLANDNTLAISGLPVGYYMLEAMAAIIGTANSGAKVRLNYTNATEVGYGHATNVDGTTDAIGTTWSTATRTDGTSLAWQWKGVISVTSATGTAAIQWAQNASHADNTTIQLGSYIKLTTIQGETIVS